MKRAVVLALVLVACKSKPEPDRAIGTELHAMWAKHGPRLPRLACDDLDGKRARLAPLTALYADAGKVWHDYTQPLPAALGTRLSSLDAGPSPADDLRCMFDDPSTKPATWTSITLFGGLMLRKGELAIAAGDDADGWRWIGESLRLYKSAPWQVYIQLFQPAWLLERATELAKTKAPPADRRDELAALARDAVMPQATLCAGFTDELFAHGANAFYGHVTDLRGAFIEHWGDELAALYTDDYAQRALPDEDTWRAYRAVVDAAAPCEATAPAALAAKLAPLVAAVKVRDANLGMTLEVATSRLGTYDRMVAAERAFTSRASPPTP